MEDFWGMVLPEVGKKREWAKESLWLSSYEFRVLACSPANLETE